MKRIKNQKGSVLSGAIVVIALLSLTLTTVSTQTFGIAQRTNTTVTSDDENIFARTMIQSVLQDLRQLILNEEPESFDQFREDQFVEEINQIENEYNQRVDEFYIANSQEKGAETVLTIEAPTPPSTETERRTKRYIVSFVRSNGSTLSKELIIDLQPDSTEPPKDRYDFSNTDDIKTYLTTEYLTEESKRDPETFKDEFFSSVSGAQDGELDSDVLVDGDIDFETPGQGASSNMGFGGYLMYVEGHLKLEDIHNLQGAGLIFVTGDLTIKTSNDMVINEEDDKGDLTIIVLGDLNLNATHSGQSKTLSGNNFHIIHHFLKNNQDMVFTGNVIESSFGDYHYLGTDPNFGVEDLLDYYQDIFGSDAGDSFSGVFNYLESAFRED